MKLKDLLDEGKVVLTSTDKNSDLPSEYPEFKVMTPVSGVNTIVFMAKTSKDLDKIDKLGDTSKRDICKQLAIFAMKKLRPLKFVPFDNYEGAGYAIQVDMNFIAKKLG